MILVLCLIADAASAQPNTLVYLLGIIAGGGFLTFLVNAWRAPKQNHADEVASINDLNEALNRALDRARQDRDEDRRRFERQILVLKEQLDQAKAERDQAMERLEHRLGQVERKGS